MLKRFAMPVVLVAAIAVSGAQAKPPAALTGKTWLLTSLNGSNRQALGITATFTPSGRISGFSGCNSYGGAYTTSRLLSISIPNRLAVTQKACSQSVMTQESAYLRALTSATKYLVLKGRLSLIGRKSRTLLRFTVQSQSLAGTKWAVTGYNNGKEAVVSVLNGTKLTANFTATDVDGSAGCNTYSGKATAAPPNIEIGPLASTKKACSTPEGVMTQEQQFLAALESAATYKIQGTTLELRTASGALAVTLHRA